MDDNNLGKLTGELLFFNSPDFDESKKSFLKLLGLESAGVNIRSYLCDIINVRHTRINYVDGMINGRRAIAYGYFEIERLVDNYLLKTEINGLHTLIKNNQELNKLFKINVKESYHLKINTKLTDLYEKLEKDKVGYTGYDFTIGAYVADMSDEDFREYVKKRERINGLAGLIFDHGRMDSTNSSFETSIVDAERFVEASLPYIKEQYGIDFLENSGLIQVKAPEFMKRIFEALPIGMQFLK